MSDTSLTDKGATPSATRRADVKTVLRPFIDSILGRNGTVSSEEWIAAVDRALDSAHRIAALEGALHDALGHIYWMSAASDFAPDGRAHIGWTKVREDARRIEEILSPAEHLFLKTTKT